MAKYTYISFCMPFPIRFAKFHVCPSGRNEGKMLSSCRFFFVPIIQTGNTENWPFKYFSHFFFTSKTYIIRVTIFIELSWLPFKHINDIVCLHILHPQLVSPSLSTTTLPGHFSGRFWLGPAYHHPTTVSPISRLFNNFIIHLRFRGFVFNFDLTLTFFFACVVLFPHAIFSLCHRYLTVKWCVVLCLLKRLHSSNNSCMNVESIDHIFPPCKSHSPAEVKRQKAELGITLWPIEQVHEWCARIRGIAWPFFYF